MKPGKCQTRNVRNAPEAPPKVAPSAAASWVDPGPGKDCARAYSSRKVFSGTRGEVAGTDAGTET